MRRSDESPWSSARGAASTVSRPSSRCETPRCTSAQGYYDTRRCETPRCTSAQGFSDRVERPGSAADCHMVRFACSTPRSGTPSILEEPAAGMPTRWPIFPPFGPEVDDMMPHSRRSTERPPTPWGACQSPASSASVQNSDAAICSSPALEPDKISIAAPVAPPLAPPPSEQGSAQESQHTSTAENKGRVATWPTRRVKPDRETNRSPWPTSTWRPISQMALASDHLPGASPRNRSAGLPSKWPRPIGAPTGGLRQYCPAAVSAQEDIGFEVVQEDPTIVSGANVESAEQVPVPEQPRCASTTPSSQVLPPSILLATLDELRKEALSKRVPKGMPQDWQPSIGAHTVKHLVNSQGRPLHSGRFSFNFDRTHKNFGRRSHHLARTQVETIYAPRNLQPWANAPMDAWKDCTQKKHIKK